MFLHGSAKSVLSVKITYLLINTAKNVLNETTMRFCGHFVIFFLLKLIQFHEYSLFYSFVWK